ncbi:M16 family metallopeptidase [Pseudosulfitobacter pseudonitzschiae]|uniref:M16 family metallopeptidase n=1 Tax=Pseudosulfitobacter pseudonitzschiae TaxID=1402135 RepID=UPI001CCF2385|nr:pitrilysin family protein [Pseudosulfitobacter pseudonitzschiae]MCA0136434.1 insulinase family protein [Pseudosulfitobacter pseudonitzschiae]MCD2328006.1 insulinase family protein [Pseudosulfitobacter pseudonitzschiae]MCD2352446.1 insulinase family protein [Pseudosulfitobacter pseudonitzschiae]MCI2215079.1 insulinase family protein [Pseudosulfitobacter pseudonitzschiae]UFE30580.1 insulinase family protein [Pseudosulfitobacter pseudonitzschiae]
MALIAALLPMAAWAANENVTTFELENGMQVVVVEDHRAPVVTHMVWYKAGSADEPKGSSGVAHFLEHLLFKATDNMAAGELSATVAANGGRDNAFTSYDYTAYYQRIAADRLGLMMKMEADRMENLRLTPENIETERDVIIEERNMRTENNPRALFGEQMSAAQYLNHRYGVPVIGWMHEMQTLDLDDALNFYDIYYSPNDAILVVAGDVDPAEVKTLAEKYYGVIPAEPNLPERVRTQEPPQTAARRVIFRDPRVAQPYVNRSYLAPERDAGDQKDAAALTILAEILGGGTTSYLAEKLQFDTQVAVYSGAFYSGVSLDDTTFDLIVVPGPDVSLQQAEDAMDAALSSFMKDGVDAEQLERIKLQLRAQQIYARDDADGVANRYGAALASGLTVADVQDWPDVLQAVTADDIMAVAKKVLRIEGSVTGWLAKPVEAGQ